MKTCILFLCFLFSHFQEGSFNAVESMSCPTDFDKRPVWNIAHMVNSLSEVDDFLSRGANGLEFDIQFDSRGNAIYTNHGFPFDFARKWWMREDIDTYLDKMAELTTPGHENYRKELVLLFLDLKVGKLTSSALKLASMSVANKLKDHYWKRGESGGRAFLMLAIPSLKQVEFITSFQEILQRDGASYYSDKIGFTFFGNEDIKDIQQVFNSFQIRNQVWQGDGITNWLPRGHGRLREVLKRRNKENSQYFNKAYSWTVDSMSTMRELLSLGVDGITTNYPDKVAAVLKEKEFSKHLRLAGIDDCPWKKHHINIEILSSSSGWWFLDAFW